MSLSRVLIANRGEIAIRIASAAAELNIVSIAIYAEDDAAALHVRKADEAVPLSGVGVAAYLDIEQIIAVAQQHNCDAIHPGYGFLSESAQFASACAAANIIFVGPTADTLSVFGDKAKARTLALEQNIPLPQGSDTAVDLAAATAFFESLGEGGAIMIKALAGGGGRGMRPVKQLNDLAAAYARCQSEALASFGNDQLYVEQLITEPRHIEIQIMGDGQAILFTWVNENAACNAASKSYWRLPPAQA